MMQPKFEERIIGHAEVRVPFKISSVGMVAGSYVLDGKITRNALAKVYRGDELVCDSKVISLKRLLNQIRNPLAMP